MHGDTDFTNPPRRRTGALAVIRDETGAVLMMQKGYKNGTFGLPGGCAHGDEAPHLACGREVSEETGLVFTPGRLLVVDYVPRNEETSVTEGLNLVFDGGTVPSNAVIVLPEPPPGEEPELIGYEFVPLDQLSELAGGHTERRVRAAVAALEDPSRHPAFLVEGRPVPVGAV
ncbi:NUDIX hydrolase [Streptomyces sp. SP18BB07]|uniref:NUDIX hydrolase n=1 Tax=Streptomyces sp. SP18BB07 TaxID=3002522 RepID=UPI002E7A7695|nr:NUDIX hydrolase [Streptomyces sp. SP18BB07]MEE1764392.1 NUDIX hydrolase [Streptomyces sp. SP18BB07]